MMFAVPCEPYKVNPVLAKALDRIFILHADHEQNASTSTVRLVGSTGASPYAAIAAGIAALWGPAHGGANEAVVKMLEEIGTPDRIPEFIEKAKDKDEPLRLMGFGHRVYKNYDPRAGVLKESADEVLAELGQKRQPEARDRPRAREDRAQRRVFRRSASCSRTSTSIRASSSRPWASRRRCSRPSSRWPEPWAGSRSGTR